MRLSQVRELEDRCKPEGWLVDACNWLNRLTNLVRALKREANEYPQPVFHNYDITNDVVEQLFGHLNDAWAALVRVTQRVSLFDILREAADEPLECAGNRLYYQQRLNHPETFLESVCVARGAYVNVGKLLYEIMNTAETVLSYFCNPLCVPADFKRAVAGIVGLTANLIANRMDHYDSGCFKKAYAAAALCSILVDGRTWEDESEVFANIAEAKLGSAISYVLMNLFSQDQIQTMRSRLLKVLQTLSNKLSDNESERAFITLRLLLIAYLLAYVKFKDPSQLFCSNEVRDTFARILKKNKIEYGKEILECFDEFVSNKPENVDLVKLAYQKLSKIHNLKLPSLR